MEANKLHVYTGDGKGKTSAGFGLLLRQLYACKALLCFPLCLPGIIRL